MNFYSDHLINKIIDDEPIDMILTELDAFTPFLI